MTARWWHHFRHASSRSWCVPDCGSTSRREAASHPLAVSRIPRHFRSLHFLRGWSSHELRCTWSVSQVGTLLQTVDGCCQMVACLPLTGSSRTSAIGYPSREHGVPERGMGAGPSSVGAGPSSVGTNPGNGSWVTHFLAKKHGLANPWVRIHALKLNMDPLPTPTRPT